MEPEKEYVFYRQSLGYKGYAFDGLSMISMYKPPARFYYTPLSSSRGMLSMIYIISDEKPEEVTIRFNGTNFFVCQNRDIVKIDEYIPFNDDGLNKSQKPFKIMETPFSPDKFNTYKINMFGNEACMNNREEKTEAYFFPIDTISHNESEIKVSFNNVKDTTIYVITEYIDQAVVKDYYGMGKNGKVVYRISCGSIGIVPQNRPGDLIYID